MKWFNGFRYLVGRDLPSFKRLGFGAAVDTSFPEISHICLSTATELIFGQISPPSNGKR